MIQTAEDLIDHDTKACVPYEHCKDLMIQFAKLHVKEALKQASEKAKTKEDVAIFAEGTYVTQKIDKDSILNAYNLDNIK